jgi:hypothetical protein
LKNLTVVDLHVPHEQMFSDGLAKVADAINDFVVGLATSKPGAADPVLG